MTVTLQPITADTVNTIMGLQTTVDQQRFVAPVVVSIAQAYFDPKAEVLAVYADEVPVGFMQWRDEGAGVAYLWRFLIDKNHQSRGYGTAAMLALMDKLRERGFTKLTLSFVPGGGSPGAFYASLGFVETGEIEDGEHKTARSL